MKVEVKRDVPVIAKTVADLRSLATWPPGLILSLPLPGDRYPESVVEVNRRPDVRQPSVLPPQKVALAPRPGAHWQKGSLIC
jgi:hypothetical protein